MPEWAWLNGQTSMQIAFWGLVISAVLLMGAHWLREGNFETRRLDIKQEMSEHLFPVVDSVSPLLNSLAETHEVGLRHRALSALENILEVRKARLCVYHLDKKDLGDDMVRILSFDGKPIGRSDPPLHKNFTEGNGVIDDANFTMVDDHQIRLVTNVSKDENSTSANPNYQCYLNAPIMADGQVRGMITIDAPGVNSLREEHISIVRIMSHLLGLSMIRRKNESLSNSPTKE